MSPAILLAQAARWNPILPSKGVFANNKVKSIIVALVYCVGGIMIGKMGLLAIVSKLFNILGYVSIPMIFVPVVFTTWQRNAQILASMEAAFPKPWQIERRGTRIGDRVYLEYGEKFDWPDLSAQEGDERVFCYGLRDQLGVLCDGTVVPCCLDHEGDIALGNLFEQDLDAIVHSPRAQAIFQGFQNRKAPEALCRKCGYARRFG